MQALHSYRFLILASTLLILQALCFQICNVEGVLLKLDSKKNKRVCFQEHLYESTPVKITLKFPTKSPTDVNGGDIRDVQIRLFGTDPEKNEYLDAHYFLQSLPTIVQDNQAFKIISHHFKSSSTLYGNYKICIEQESKLKEVELDLHIDVGKSAEVEFEELESVKHVKKIETLLKNLGNQITTITSEQIYFKHREERFRETTDSTYERLWIVAVLQVMILVMSAWWQLSSLKTFFRKQKLI
ncbi:hypothetical protein C9374_010769 [Naegleria lovaniensis]|uniref:GOLD domain-containing protein n=1 Tax=Naegleria lovaniensis TaxID=51637 RepID=A0AA88GFE6_NAELO|nr:uncharacterized protein C9374_010769 [Naegleria lovaniensis]KAG2374485.1 hypothetical protein C9374_010769 [Naegleria lovaniensis]